jgi:hypothetical protein
LLSLTLALLELHATQYENQRTHARTDEMTDKGKSKSPQPLVGDTINQVIYVIYESNSVTFLTIIVQNRNSFSIF